MDPGAIGVSVVSGIGEASICITWPWKGWSSSNGTQLTPLCWAAPVEPLPVVRVSAS